MPCGRSGRSSRPGRCGAPSTSSPRARSRSSYAASARGSAGRARSGCATSRSAKREMVALQECHRRPAQRRADDPPGARRLRSLGEAGQSGAFAERVTSSWGTFLKPAAGRGLPRVRARPRPERDLRPSGRVAGHRHPGARRRRVRCRPRPPPRRVSGRRRRASSPGGGERPGEPRDRTRRERGSATGSSSSIVEGTKAYVLAEDLRRACRHLVEPWTSVRLLPAFDPYTLSLQKEAEALLPIARRPLVSRTAGWISAVVLVGGVVGAAWTHEAQKGWLAIAVAPWRGLGAERRRATARPRGSARSSARSRDSDRRAGLGEGPAGYRASARARAPRRRRPRGRRPCPR